jgi:type VI secretion system protein ImpA
MPSPSVIDIVALSAPVPGDSPAGGPLPYDVRLKLEELRKEINPADYDADDPRRPTEHRKPDWPGIVKLASDTLTNTSKDLLAAARLTEALTVVHGMPGLRDGISLLTRLASDAWGRMYPPIEDGESPEVREGPFKWLNQVGYGAMFPHTLRTLPLLTVGGRGYSLSDWQNQSTRGQFESAIGGASDDAVRNLVDDLKGAREGLQALATVLHEKMGDYAPDLVSSENTENLGAALNDCLKAANQILARKTGVAAPAGTDDVPAPVGGGATVSKTLASRADAYRMLNQAADLLQQIEPHSPIPYLVKRAVRLGDLKFPELMRALIRENVVLDELDRLIGIAPPPPPAG